MSRIDYFGLVYEIMSVVDNPDSQARGRIYAQWRSRLRVALPPGRELDLAMHELERAIIHQEMEARARTEQAGAVGDLPDA